MDTDDGQFHALQRWDAKLTELHDKWLDSKRVEDWKTYVIGTAAYFCSELFRRSGRHWFCQDDVTRQRAISSLTLFSFKLNPSENSAAAERYKLYEDQLAGMLHRCSDCGVKYQISGQELVNLLTDKVHVSSDVVEEFFNEMLHRDKNRLDIKLKEDPDSISALSESLWSVSCITSHLFRTKHFIEDGPFKSGDSAVIKQFGASPGILHMKFVTDANLRKASLDVLSAGGTQVDEYLQAWTAAPGVFRRTLELGLKRSSQAQDLADSSWFTTARLLKALSASNEISASIIKVAVTEMKRAQGVAKFGAHYLAYHILDRQLAAMNDPQLTPYVKSEDIELILDYVSSNVDLVYPTKLPQRLSNDTTLPMYRDLNAQVAVAWFKVYLSLGATIAQVKRRLHYLLQLQRSAFKTDEQYQALASAAFKAASVHPEELFEEVLDGHVDFLVASSTKLSTDAFYRLWKYQQERAPRWSKFWGALVKDPQFGTRTLSAVPTSMGAAVGMLQGSRSVGLVWQLPLREKVTDHSQPAPQTDAETVIIKLLEQLVDNGEAEQLSEIMKDSRVLQCTLMITSSGNKALSFSAKELFRKSLDEESYESAIATSLRNDPKQFLAAVNSVVQVASPAASTSLGAMPGIVRLLSRVTEQIYDVNDGIDTTSDPNVLEAILSIWQKSWEMIANVMKQIKDWAKKYATSHLKPIMMTVLEFSKALLAIFRLVEADAGEVFPATQNWGAKLADPVIATIEKMSSLLQLNISELLNMASEIIIDILGLMSSFGVPPSPKLLELLEGLATRSIRSKLTRDQLKVLLTAVGLSESETSKVLDQRISGILFKPMPEEPALCSAASSASASATRPVPAAGSAHAAPLLPGQQKSIGDFFKTTTGKTLVVPPRQIVNNKVVPHAAPTSSAVSQIRAQLSGTSTHMPRFGGVGLGIVAHPERPPGFNQPRPLNASAAQVSEHDDSDDEDEGALEALGAKQKKRDEAQQRLKEAHQRSLERKPRAQLPDFDRRGPTLMHTAQQQKDREERAMKARLNTQPTELHRELLSWDYFSEDAPVIGNGSIPDRFESAEQYQHVMAPLLYMEAWEGIRKSKEEAAKQAPYVLHVVFGKRVKVDGFTDVYVSVTKNDFAAAKLSESDVLLLAYETGAADEDIMPSPAVPHCLARIKEGTVKRSRSAAKQHVDFQVRLNAPLAFLNPLHNGSCVSAVNLGSFTTVEREFTALMALPHYNLLPDILAAKPAVAQDNPNTIVRLQTYLNVNESQATAINRATRTDGFSLIQGPPGTGKTKTILGIVGSIFTRNPVVANVEASTGGDDKKVLICAPSNAAIDEIVLRLKAGVTNTVGELQKLSILRLGRPELVNEQVRDVTLEAMISKDLDNTAELSDSTLRREHTTLTLKRNDIRDKLKLSEGDDMRLSAREVQALSDELKAVNQQLRDKNYALDAQRERLEVVRKQRDARFRQQQNDLLSKTQVICSTLSGSAHPVLSSLGIAFDTVIIDEAAQSIELSSLIPLKYGATKCILVGDPNQLPPTVLSKEASVLKYEQSLFVRIFNQNKHVKGAISMLNMQFRMHPDISQFPSSEFYSKLLLDGPDLAASRTRPWHSESRAMGPYTFFDIKGKHERSDGHSLKNAKEASAALTLVKLLRRNHPECTSIGVISPYREQVRFMEQMFIQSFGAEITSIVDFHSIDGFQGQEKDVIIMSCVRAADARTNHIGFVGDVRRMNVALTRARTSLWILGNRESLEVNPVWKRLISDASARGRLVRSHHDNLIGSIERFNNLVRPVGKRPSDSVWAESPPNTKLRSDSRTQVANQPWHQNTAPRSVSGSLPPEIPREPATTAKTNAKATTNTATAANAAANAAATNAAATTAKMIPSPAGAEVESRKPPPRPYEDVPMQMGDSFESAGTTPSSATSGSKSPSDHSPNKAAQKELDQRVSLNSEASPNNQQQATDPRAPYLQGVKSAHQVAPRPKSPVHSPQDQRAPAQVLERHFTLDSDSEEDELLKLIRSDMTPRPQQQQHRTQDEVLARLQKGISLDTANVPTGSLEAHGLSPRGNGPHAHRVPGPRPHTISPRGSAPNSRARPHPVPGAKPDRRASRPSPSGGPPKPGSTNPSVKKGHPRSGKFMKGGIFIPSKKSRKKV